MIFHGKLFWKEFLIDWDSCEEITGAGIHELGKALKNLVGLVDVDLHFYGYWEIWKKLKAYFY